MLTQQQRIVQQTQVFIHNYTPKYRTSKEQLQGLELDILAMVITATE